MRKSTDVRELKAIYNRVIRAFIMGFFHVARTQHFSKKPNAFYL